MSPPKIPFRLIASSRWLALACYAVLAALFGFVVHRAMAPGSLTYDSIHQLQQAIGEIPYDDWHPVIMSLTWSGLIDLTGSIGSLAAAHILVAAICAFLTCVYLYLLSNRFAVGLLGLALFASPYVVSLLGIIWKDTQMGLAYYAGFLLLLFGRRFRSWSPVFVFLSIPCFVYGTLVRKNAILALLPLICFAAVVLASNPRVVKFIRGNLRRWGLSTAAVLVMFGAFMAGTSAVVNNISHPSHRSQFTQVMLDDLIFAIPATTIENSSAPAVVKDKLIAAKRVCKQNGSEWDAYWKCYGRGANGKGFTEVANKDDIVQLWINTIPHNIPRYLDYRSQTFAKFLFTSKNEYRDTIKLGAQYNLDYHSPRLHDAFVYYVNDFGIKQVNWWYQAWFWLIVSAAICFRYLTRWKQYVAELALSSSALIYIVTYFPTVPAQDYRYIYWSAMATSLAVLLLIARRFGRKRTHRSSQPAGASPHHKQDPIDSLGKTP